MAAAFRSCIDIGKRADNTDSHGWRLRGGEPLGFVAGDENLYRYVKNNPTLLTDASGLCPDVLLLADPAATTNVHQLTAAKAVLHPTAEHSKPPGAFVAAGPFDEDLDALGNPVPGNRNRMQDLGPGPPLPPGLLLPPTDEEHRLLARLHNPDGTPREIQEAGVSLRGIVRLVSLVLGRARSAAPVIVTTAHGAQRLAERGFTPIVIAETRVGHVLRQADGCTVYVRQVEPGRFNVLIENAQGAIVSALPRIDALALRNLAINYGWTAP